MRIIINGKEENINGNKITVTQILKAKDVNMPDMVSVELNEQFLNRQDYASIKIKEGDKIEFLYFMGGGE